MGKPPVVCVYVCSFISSFFVLYERKTKTGVGDVYPETNRQASKQQNEIMPSLSCLRVAAGEQKCHLVNRFHALLMSDT